MGDIDKRMQGALAKELIVSHIQGCASCPGGAKPMEGITPDSNIQYDGVPLDPPPSMRQGFGAAHLGRALPIASNPSGWSMQVPYFLLIHCTPFLPRGKVYLQTSCM